jgi:hypothetical protein
MSHIEPTAGKHRRLFECKDRGIRKYLAAHCPITYVNKTPTHDLSLVLHSNDDAVPEQTLIPESGENLT